MTLPKPTTTIYQTTLPTTKTKVKYRPWTIAEEKTLLIAKDDNDPETARMTLFNVLEACTDNKIDIQKLSDIDIDWLMFQVSARSDGEISTLISKCGNCGKDSEYDCDKIKDVAVEGDLNILSSNKIQVDDNIWFELSLPTKKDIDDLVNNDLEIEEIIARCLKSIYTTDDVFSPTEYKPDELIAYVKSFEPVKMVGVHNFFKNYPKVVLTHSKKCKHCGTENTLRIEGFNDFFL